MTGKSNKTDLGAGARVLFLYPNERGMSTVPAAIAILSQLLKDAGHQTSIFDTTFYKFDDEISVGDTDETLTKSLNYRPVQDEDDEDLYFKKTTNSRISEPPFQTSDLILLRRRLRRPLSSVR